MIQRRSSARLLLEARQAIAVFRELSRKQLERDFPVEAFVTGQIYLAHSTSAKRGQNLIVAETLTDQFVALALRHPSRRNSRGNLVKGTLRSASACQ